MPLPAGRRPLLDVVISPLAISPLVYRMSGLTHPGKAAAELSARQTRAILLMVALALMAVPDTEPALV